MYRFRALLMVIGMAGLLIVTGCGQSAEEFEGVQEFNAEITIDRNDQDVKTFLPPETTVTGDHGKLVVNNKFDVEHGFVIKEFGIRAAVPGNSTQTFEIPRAEPGEYMIECHLHAAHEPSRLIVNAPTKE